MFSASERAPLLSKQQLKQEQTQEQRAEIEAIFAAILANNSSLTRLYKDVYGDEFEVKQKPLLAYKDALLKELDYLPVSYDHPLRAARALKAACENIGKNDSLTYIQQFEEEASNSKFNPNLKALGWSIVIALVSFVVACGFVALGLVTSPYVMYFAVGALGLGAMSPAFVIESYMPVTSARSQGKEVSSNLKLLQTLWAQRTERAAEDTEAADNCSIQNSSSDIDLDQNGSSQEKSGFVYG